MGKIVTPTYRIEYRDNHIATRLRPPDCLSRIDRKPVALMTWSVDRLGKPTEANLQTWRVGYNASFAPGGCNQHLSQSDAGIPHIFWARIVRQRDDRVMCEIMAPAFEAAA